MTALSKVTHARIEVDFSKAAEAPALYPMTGKRFGETHATAANCIAAVSICSAIVSIRQVFVNSGCLLCRDNHI